MRVQCQCCPAKNQRVRVVKFEGKKLHLCPICIRTLNNIIKREQQQNANAN